MTSGTGSSAHVEQEQGGEIAEREHGADAEIDAAGDQAKRHADGDEAELGVEPHQRKKILQPGIVGNRRGEPEQQRDHQGEGDHRLEPLLQQQFREQQPRRQAGVQPRAEAGAHGVDRHQRAPSAAAHASPVGDSRRAAEVAINPAISCRLLAPSAPVRLLPSSAGRSNCRRWRCSCRARSAACSTHRCLLPGFCWSSSKVTAAEIRSWPCSVAL